jgi:hypothetical protein
MWTYFVKQFKRDRLAAFTFQTAIKELLAFVKIDEMRTFARTKACKDRIGVYIQVLEARTALFERVKHQRDLRALQVTDKIARLWVRKINLHRFWTWRGLLPPAKREFARRIKRIQKLQAIFRGIRTRASPIGIKVQDTVESVRTEIFVGYSTKEVQRYAKGFLLHYKINQLWDAAAIIQYNCNIYYSKQKYLRLKRSAIRLQSAFRRFQTQQLLIWEKLKVLHSAERAYTQKMTYLMRRRMFKLVGVKPVSIIYMDVHADVMPFYPDGWLHNMTQFLRRESVRKIALGAEHTMVLGLNGLYGWGSDEVGQLGISTLGPESKQGERKRRAPVHPLTAPLLKNKVLDVCCGRWHTIAHIEGVHSVACWGLNHRGQCGVKTYQAKEPFTPVYPRLVRAPAFPQTDDVMRVTQIAAGPFSSAVLVKESVSVNVEPQLYMWGEGNSCGQEKDVCLPMHLSTEHLRFPLQSVFLGDGFGMLKHSQGLAAWGIKCAHLGVGFVPDMPQRMKYGFVVVDPLLRFDAHPELGLRTLHSARLVRSPIPVSIPVNVAVSQICLAQDHVAMLSQENSLYEWGCVEVLRVHWDGQAQQQQGEELGLVYVPTPMRVEISEGAKDLRCAGRITVVLPQSSPTVIGWTQLVLVSVGASLSF